MNENLKIIRKNCEMKNQLVILKKRKNALENKVKQLETQQKIEKSVKNTKK